MCGINMPQLPFFYQGMKNGTWSWREDVGFIHINCFIRVNWLVTEHLSTQGKPDPREGLHYFWCPKKPWTPTIGASSTLKIVKNGVELTKLRPLQVEGSRTKKNKPPNVTKVSSWTPKKFLVIFFFQRWFVKL
jgi:hypothetical protein